MALTITRSSSGTDQIITIAGELDGSSAPQLRDEVEKAAEEKPKRLVLMLKDLEYMSSAGIRVIVYAKQKMGTEVDIYVVAAQAPIADTLQKTGVDKSVYMVDKYESGNA
jgi:anti-anti-sigma factor